MLLRQLTDAQKQALLKGFDATRAYESTFPVSEVTADAELDPAITAAMDTKAVADAATQGLQRRVLTSMVAADWLNASRHQTFRLYENAGVLSDIPLTDLAGIFSQVSSGAFLVSNEDKVADVMLDYGLNLTSRVLSSVPNVYVQIAAGVVQMAAFIVNAIRDLDTDAGSVAPELRLQNAGVETDEFQVQQSFRLMGGDTPDYTALFAPRFDAQGHDWVVQRRSGGWAFAPGKEESAFTPAQFMATGSLGMMPGARRTTSVIQVVRPRLWGNHNPYCDGSPTKGEKAKCAMHAVGSVFKRGKDRGEFDCEARCLRANSDIPYSDDVGSYYSSLNTTLLQLGTYIGNASPALYTINGAALDPLWRDYVGKLFDQLPYLFSHYSGWGWKAAVAAAGGMLLYNPSFNAFGVMVGGQIQKIEPWKTIAPNYSRYNAYDTVIGPAIERLRARQKGYLKTTLPAYLPRSVGADGDPNLDIEGAKRDILTSQARFSIRMRDVVDRSRGGMFEALVESGVKPDQLGLGMKLPEERPDTKPKPTVMKAIPAEVQPIDPTVLTVAALDIPEPDDPKGDIGPTDETPAASPGTAIAVAGGAAVLGVGAWLALRKRGRR